MQAVRSRRWWIVLGVLVLVAAVGVGIATATVTSNTLTDTNVIRLKAVHSEFVPSDDQPTFSSGWHTHPGPVIFQVQKGTVKIFQLDCEPKVLRPGDTYIEIPGVPILATANKAAEWTTTLIRDELKPDKADLSSSPCP